jgi:hypothetical protein
VLLHFGDVGWGEVGASLASESFDLTLSSIPILFLLNPDATDVLFLPFFSVAVVTGRGTVKYFSPMTNLCVIRVARGAAASTTWAALVLLDKVGGGQGQGRRVIPHVIHVSGTSHFAPIFIFSL